MKCFSHRRPYDWTSSCKQSHNKLPSETKTHSGEWKGYVMHETDCKQHETDCIQLPLSVVNIPSCWRLLYKWVGGGGNIVAVTTSGSKLIYFWLSGRRMVRTIQIAAVCTESSGGFVQMSEGKTSAGNMETVLVAWLLKTLLAFFVYPRSAHT